MYPSQSQLNRYHPMRECRVIVYAQISGAAYIRIRGRSHEEESNERTDLTARTHAKTSALLRTVPETVDATRRPTSLRVREGDGVCRVPRRLLQVRLQSASVGCVTSGFAGIRIVSAEGKDCGKTTTVPRGRLRTDTKGQSKKIPAQN